MEENKNQDSNKKIYWVALTILVVFAAFGGGWILKENTQEESSIDSLTGNDPGAKSLEDGLKIDPEKYQAVFLSNGEVYFGKVSSTNPTYLELSDIYYIQVVPALQQSQNEDKEKEKANSNENQDPQQQNQITIIKLGDELHGPQDRMMINKNMITYIEDLKNDSKVTQAIGQHKNKK